MRVTCACERHFTRGLTASSLNLTQYDVEEVQEHCGGRFNHREIQCLYKRFRSLDKRHKGYISEDELLSIPELAISPLASRVVQVFQNLNFKDFVRLLAAFSDRASREDKLQFMFRVYDVDRDGHGWGRRRQGPLALRSFFFVFFFPPPSALDL